MTKKDIVKNNFSKYAGTYDNYSDVQEECAAELIGMVENRSFTRILDIGCGTGNYTVLLREAFPEAKITAMDVSGKMIEIAGRKLSGKDIEFVLCDAEGADLGSDFDLISSNAGFQWFDNLERAVAKYANKMKKGGTILFSVFGPETFTELAGSLKILLGEKAAISSSYFLNEKEIKAILETHFNEIRIEKKICKREHSTLSEFLKIIKYSGTRGSGIRTGYFWSPGMLRELERVYKGMFSAEDGGKIIASYEVLFCRGIA